MTARVTSRLVIIMRNKSICSVFESHAQRRDRIQREHPSKAFGLLEQYTRGDDAAGGVGGEVAEANVQLVECGQHVERMLAHRIVGEIGQRLRPVAFAAAAPVDADHTDIAGKQRGGEFDPVLAGEIAVDEDDGNDSSAPLPPAKLNLASLHPRHGNGPICSGRP
jgi:hypothetical protein